MSYYDLNIGQIPASVWLGPLLGKHAEEIDKEGERRKEAAGRGTGFLISIRDNGSTGDGLFLDVLFDETREDGDEILAIRIPDESIDTLCEALEAIRRLRKVQGE